jgi:membrane protein
MAGMWRLSGLSLPELLKRTARESWQDDVFGQAARLAFYHFIAIFPALLLILLPLARSAGAGADMRRVLIGSFRQFLPNDAALLVAGAIRDLDTSLLTGNASIAIAIGSAIWAGINASWAMIAGLNVAYETTEDRNWWKIARTAAGLSFALLALVFLALLSAHYLEGLLKAAIPYGFAIAIAKWIVLAGILLISFAVFYRFGPNLRSRKWQWSTPGAVFGTVLWLGSTVLVREYFDRFGSYRGIYGRAAAAATLLMWLYLTSATVLIGAELNSEIEKARESTGSEEPERIR